VANSSLYTLSITAMGIAHQFLDPDNTKAQATQHGVGEVVLFLALEYKYQDVVERLDEHSLEDCLGRQKAIAIYIVDGWGAGFVSWFQQMLSKLCSWLESRFKGQYRSNVFSRGSLTCK